MFAQVVEVVHQQLVARCVERYQDNDKVQEFTRRELFRCRAFAQSVGFLERRVRVFGGLPVLSLAISNPSISVR